MALGTPSAATAYVDVQPDVGAFSGALDDLLAPITSKFEGKFGKFGKAATLGFGAVVVGAGLAGKALYDIGAQFDDAYDTIQTGTGATGKQLEGLKNDFRDVVGSVPTDFGSASQAITQLNQRLGITGKPLRALSKQMLELSRITETDLDSNIQSVTRTFGDWGIKVRQQPAFLDRLFRASQKTGISVGDLGEQMVRYGAPLRQLGFGFSEAAAMVGKFEKEGVNTQLVMGSLRIGLGKIAEESGVSVPRAFRDIVDSIQAFKKDSAAIDFSREIFGARAGADFADTVRQGRFEFGELVKQIDSGKATIRGTGKDTMDFAESWQMLKNRVFLILEPLATRVFNAVGKGMRDVTRFFRELTTEGSNTQKEFGPILKALELGGKGLWLAYKFFIGNIVKAFKGLAAGVRAVDAAVTWLQRLPNRVGRVFSNVVSAIGGFFKSLYQKGRQAASNVVSGVVDFLSNLPGKFFSALKSMGEKIGTTISNAVKSAVNSIIDLFNAAVPDKISVPKLPDINLPDNPIPRLGAGGRNLGPGMYEVGDLGPELLTISGSGRVDVLSNRDSRSLLGRSAGGEVHHHWHAINPVDVSDEESFLEQANHRIQMAGVA